MGQSNRQIAKNLQLKAMCALVFSAWAMPALALDLGRLQILSAIGEPLRAEVEIAQSTPEELKSLRAQLASANSFNQAGMEFNPALVGLTATLQNRNNGTSFIALNGQVPVRENFVDLILETQWATGRLVRNYALLLNSVSDLATSPNSHLTFAPPPRLEALPIASNPAPTQGALTRPVQAMPLPDGLNASSVVLNEQSVPVYRFDPIDNSQAAAASKPAALATPAVSARPDTAAEPAPHNGSSLRVERGDTASRLAMRYLAANVSLDQMLLAMLQANPDAFIQGNVNLVKAGAVLRIPSPDEALQIPRAQARKLVLAQTRDFAEYARRLAESTLLVDSKNSREMVGKVAVEPVKETEQAPQQDKLTLSKSSVRNDSAEAALAAEREAQDTATQLAELNKNLQDLEALTKGAPSPTTTSSQAQLTSSAANTAEPSANAPTQPAKGPSSFLKEVQENQQVWTWAAALLAVILLFVFWVRRKSREPETVYAPSYDDVDPPSTEPTMAQPLDHAGMPSEITSIDLNLQPQSSSGHPPGPHANSPAPAPSTAAPSPSSSGVEDTEMSKLNLAAQLLAKGDKDLARALILSVVSSSSGDLKAKAIQLLGQIR